MYSLLHRCVSQTLLELSADSNYLGATPGIIQILHTWGQALNYHPHIHCIVAGAGLTKVKQFKRSWNEFRNSLYHKQWIPFVKETFHGFGNAVDYLGRYTHRIAISNSRIKSVTDTHITFTAKDYRTNETNDITVNHVEFIRRFLMHVLPFGFQKIRYYGFLNNRYKKVNLKLICRLTGKQLLKSLYTGLNSDELLLALWNINVHLCPNCGCNHFRHAGRTFHNRN